MKVSDYIVEFLINNEIKDIYGYQGTMIAHFVDSVCKNDKIKNHICYNEQGAAFAAVGSAKANGKLSCAYATSGPGAINLVSGIADAYYDSMPVLFITGQLNLYEYTDIKELRQQGFQETDVVSICKSITKYCVQITDKNDIAYELEKAVYIAQNGRKGPVLLDIPMNIQREEIDTENIKHFNIIDDSNSDGFEVAKAICDAISDSKSPVLFLGNAIVKGSDTHKKIIDFARKYSIPVMTTLPARHLLDYTDKLNLGFLGAAYGHRTANIISYKKADLIVSIGSSFCKRQTGFKSQNFAANAKIIRIDIDSIELSRKVHDDDVSFCADLHQVVDELSKLSCTDKGEWLNKCVKIREKLEAFETDAQGREPNKLIETISSYIDDNAVICPDVGQHQLWCGQSFKIKGNQKMLFSGGHGAMGFALPAAIGAHYATGGHSVAICGDGSMQMNIQELQWVAREQIPMTIFVMNNASLGLIQQQQDDFFGGNHFGSTDTGGYTAPCFADVARAYKIDAVTVTDTDELKKACQCISDKPYLIEVMVDTKSKAYPKTYFGEEMYNQKPYISNELMEWILNI